MTKLFAALMMVVTIPVFLRLGSEFMPPLDEGTLHVRPYANVRDIEFVQVLTEPAL